VGDQALAARRLPALVAAASSNFGAHKRRTGQAVTAVPRTPGDTPVTPFANAFTRHQVVARAALALDDLVEIRRAAGVSRNDVVLGVVAGAVRGYLEARRALPDAPLVTSIPMAIPTPAEPDRRYGNHIMGFSTSLATDIADPWERLGVISAVAAEAKAGLAVLDPAMLWEWLDVIPPLLARRATTHQYRRRRKDPSTVDQNLLVSNFRGPEEPWRFGPATCDEFYWFGPPNQGVGLNVSMWSYADRVLIGIEAFADALDDPGELVERLGRSAAELLALARARSGRSGSHLAS